MARVPALSVEIVKQSHDTKGFVVLPRRWVGRHPGFLGLAGTRRFDRNRRCSRGRRSACVQRAAASASAAARRGPPRASILVAPPADREPFQRERNRLSGGVQNPPAFGEAGVRLKRCDVAVAVHRIYHLPSTVGAVDRGEPGTGAT